MVRTVTTQWKGRMPKEFGPGPKFVQGVVTITPNTATLRAQDIDAMMIRDLYVHAQGIGTFAYAIVNTPGSVRNTGSIQTLTTPTGGGSASYVFDSGAGTHVISFLALIE